MLLIYKVSTLFVQNNKTLKTCTTFVLVILLVRVYPKEIRMCIKV